MPITPALLIWADSMASALPPVDAALLTLGDRCYTVAMADGGGKPAGNVLRRVERLDRKRLMITIASRFNGGPLLTSRIEVALPSLRPIRTIDLSDGRPDLSVRYGANAAKGVVTGDDGTTQAAKTPLPGPVWDEETIEFVVATLPLAEDAYFEIPIFHFGRSPAVRRVEVLRSISVEHPGRGPVDAWEVASSTASDMTVTFQIAKVDRELLGITAGGVRSYLGGDCSGLLN